MATVVFHNPFDQRTFAGIDGRMTVQTATQVVVEEGSDTASYYGHFTYGPQGIRGPLDSLDIDRGGIPTVSVYGLDGPADTYEYLIANNDIGTIYARMLAGADDIYGSQGHDGILSYAGADWIEAGGGFDTIVSRDGDDTVFAGTGGDQIFAGHGDDLIFGGQGNDSDYVEAGTGNDDVYAGGGNDLVYGQDGHDVLGGGQGADELYGGGGDDVLFGGGGQGADQLLGEWGNDRAFAGAGNDFVSGGFGHDEIGGGSGADVLIGGAGDDILYLGLYDGATDVVVATTDNGRDAVYGFETGIDYLDVRSAGFRSSTELYSAIYTAADGSAAIDLGYGDAITLVGVYQGELHESDFLY